MYVLFQQDDNQSWGHFLQIIFRWQRLRFLFFDKIPQKLLFKQQGQIQRYCLLYILSYCVCN